MSGELRDVAFDLGALAGLRVEALALDPFFAVAEAEAPGAPRGAFGAEYWRRLIGRAELVAQPAELHAVGIVREPEPPAPTPSRRLAPVLPAPAREPAVPAAFLDFLEYAHRVRARNDALAQILRRGADDLLAAQHEQFTSAVEEARGCLARALTALEALPAGVERDGAIEHLRQGTHLADRGLALTLAQARRAHRENIRAAERLASLACCPPVNPGQDLVELLKAEVAKHHALGGRVPVQVTFEFRWGSIEMPRALTTGWSDGRIVTTINAARLSRRGLPSLIAHELHHAAQIASRGTDHHHSPQEVEQLERDAVDYAEASVGDDNLAHVQPTEAGWRVTTENGGSTRS